MSGWHHKNAKWQFRDCGTCGKSFKPNSGGHKYCSPECGYEAANPRNLAEYQYKLISGNWRKYFTRLVQKKGREQLTADILLFLLGAQNTSCALTGEPLTCILIKGVQTWTNASIDRIDPKQGYTLDNIQLVTRRANLMKSNLSMEDFIKLCRQIAERGDGNG